jgi:hypothetical protein
VNAGVWILRFLAAWTVVSLPATLVIFGLLRRTGEDVEPMSMRLTGVGEVPRDAGRAAPVVPGQARVA